MADMTDAIKRKEPEPETPAPAAATASTVPAESAKAAEPEAKRPKVLAKPASAAVLRKQVEYYMSDQNLRTDRFFSEKIAADKEGWLDMSLILSCNKMKALRATKEDVAAALKDSKLQLRDEGAAVRRPGNAALPTLEAKPQHHQKKAMHAHDGGCVFVFKSLPAEQSWQQVKEVLEKKLPPKVPIWHVSEVSDKSQCSVICPPFEGDLALFDGLELELGGATVKSEICFGEQLQNTLKSMPKYIRDKRERESKKRQKDRNRPIMVGNQRFVNVGALRGKVKEVMNSRSDGEQLKPEGTDFKLVKALLEFHPKGAEKTSGMTGIKVAKSQQGDSRCFYMIKGDGMEEDVSVKKCIDAIELNPPYVERKPAEAAKKAESSAAEEKKEEKDEKAKDEPPKEAAPAKAEDAPAKAEETPAKVDEAKAEEPAKAEDAKAEEAKPEEAKAEAKAEEKPAASA